jgi:hypothetical protein
MSSIGGGYVWPNVTIESDGEQIMVDAQPTQFDRGELLRYITQIKAALPAAGFEGAVDDFVELVCGKFVVDKIADSNLENSWSDLLSERRNPEARLAGNDISGATSAESALSRLAARPPICECNRASDRFLAILFLRARRGHCADGCETLCANLKVLNKDIKEALG